MDENQIDGVRYYDIDEPAARRAKEMNSHSDYKAGSATAEYRAAIDEAAAIAARQKAATDPRYHGKIDRLLDIYARRLAENMNEGFAIDARVPSILVAGPVIPARAKERQNAARDRNMEDWRRTRGLLDKIRSTGTGGISADDPSALDKLKSKLAAMEAVHSQMKDANAYYRKHGTVKGHPRYPDEHAAQVDDAIKRDYSWNQQPFPSWQLTNHGAEMRRLRQRIESLERAQASTFPEWVFEGGRVVANQEVNRLQIFFDGIPTPEQRQAMKGRGFKYAKSQNHAWQRQLNGNALYAAKQLPFLEPKEGFASIKITVPKKQPAMSRE